MSHVLSKISAVLNSLCMSLGKSWQPHSFELIDGLQLKNCVTNSALDFRPATASWNLQADSLAKGDVLRGSPASCLDRDQWELVPQLTLRFPHFTKLGKTQLGVDTSHFLMGRRERMLMKHKLQAHGACAPCVPKQVPPPTVDLL